LDSSHTWPKTEVALLFHRAGLPPEQIDKILAQLPDPIDLERDQPILEKSGLSRERLMDMMGGSP
jgi:hypothetical protein